MDPELRGDAHYEHQRREPPGLHPRCDRTLFIRGRGKTLDVAEQDGDSGFGAEGGGGMRLANLTPAWSPRSPGPRWLSLIFIIIVFPDEENQQQTQRRRCHPVFEEGTTSSLINCLGWADRMSQVGASPAPERGAIPRSTRSCLGAENSTPGLEIHSNVRRQERDPPSCANFSINAKFCFARLVNLTKTDSTDNNGL